ncbi:hypothetical protein A9R00_08750 [Oleispira antarctica]|uniref:YfaZ n=1 Tax=Oleispira antarctica TaxID=188908 RepID=A0A1Y5HXV4_OLEAN|nr:hypothetical protein A9R00_08750 [Oleispira antarctica]
MKALKLICSSLFLTVSMNALAGGSLDISLSSDAARFEYDAAKVGSGLHVSASLQHHETEGDLMSAGMHVVDMREPDSPLYLGVGGKVFGYVADDYDGIALGLGGFFRYNIPKTKGVSLAGYAYYAPSVVSFGDTENLIDSDIRIQYALLPTARVYMGYRYSQVNVDGTSKDVTLEQGMHLGLKVDF